MGPEAGATVTWGLLALVVLKEVALPTGRAVLGRFAGRAEAAAEAVPTLAAKLDGVIATLVELKQSLTRIQDHETRIVLLERGHERLEEETQAARERHHSLANILMQRDMKKRREDGE